MATVNGEPIYNSDIIEAKARMELQINDNLSKMDEISSSERQDYINKYRQTNEQILKLLVRDKVLIQNALKSGIKTYENDIYNQAKSEVNSLKEDDPDFYNITLKAYVMSEDEYLNNIYIPNVKNRYLRSQFKKNLKISEHEFEKYLDNLVAQSNIRYNLLINHG